MSLPLRTVATTTLDAGGENETAWRWLGMGRSRRTGEAYGCPLEFVRGTQAMIDRVFQVESAVQI